VTANSFKDINFCAVSQTPMSVFFVDFGSDFQYSGATDQGCSKLSHNRRACYMANDEQEIRDLVARWIQASMAGDVDTIHDLIAEDAVFHGAGREPFGKEAYVQSFRRGLEQVSMEVRSEIAELQVAGNLAYLRNQLWVTMTPRGGGVAMKRTGYSLTILRKLEDGRWVLSRDANMLTHAD
jgi:uncharacterized protein (TIGR02246 family)